MDQYNREPCPWRILGDCGGAFTMGIIGGSIFNFYGGAKNAPKGFNHRMYGGLARTRLKAPVLGGQFAAWCLCYASFECSLSAIRKKEDHWNSIASGAGAGVVMAARQGPAAMVVSGIMGGFLLGLIEGMGVLMNHMASTAYRPVDPQNPPQDPNVFGGMEIKN